MDERIERALERLDKEHGVYVALTAEGREWPITAPLAALIRKAAEPELLTGGDYEDRHFCRICDNGEDCSKPIDHAPDCALIALCEAVVG